MTPDLVSKSEESLSVNKSKNKLGTERAVAKLLLTYAHQLFKFSQYNTICNQMMMMQYKILPVSNGVDIEGYCLFDMQFIPNHFN